MKGISKALIPFLISGGRVSLDTMRKFAMNSEMIDEEEDDFRLDAYTHNITSFLNQNDFYSVGDGIFCHIDSMTDDERRNTATKLDSTGKRYIEKAEKILDGQGYINPETMEIVFPDPVRVNE